MSEPAPPRPRSTGRAATLGWVGAGLAILLCLGAVVVLGLPHAAASASAAAPGATSAPGIDARAADLLQLDLLTPPAVSAPDFTLTDQHGRPQSLAQLRGKAVVLSFNDDRCQDLCTLLAQDVVAADQDLGAAAAHVVFLSVNANPLHTAVADVASWSTDHGLAGSPNWVFDTGSPARLAQVARDYHVSVTVDPKTQEVVHGTELFFIDPAGTEVAIGQFGTRSASTALFAHAMAQLAVDLLPAGARTTVAGPTGSAPTGTAALNGPAPALTLPELDHPSTMASLAGTRGSYTVVNFWASTCTACAQELPALQQAHADLGATVSFIGVDVADPAGAASAFARASGVSYPLLTDADGTAAGTYQVSGLPFTAIIGPDGTLLVRHPGTFTAEQLEYIITTLRNG